MITEYLTTLAVKLLPVTRNGDTKAMSEKLSREASEHQKTKAKLRALEKELATKEEELVRSYQDNFRTATRLQGILEKPDIAAFEMTAVLRQMDKAERKLLPMPTIDVKLNESYDAVKGYKNVMVAFRPVALNLNYTDLPRAPEGVMSIVFDRVFFGEVMPALRHELMSQMTKALNK